MIHLLAAILIVSPGQIMVSDGAGLTHVEIVTTCGAAVTLHPLAPWFDVMQTGSCDAEHTLAFGKQLTDDAVYPLFSVDGCPTLGQECSVDVRYECDPVAVKPKTWGTAKRLWR